jgi:hypothetical protein
MNATNQTTTDRKALTTPAIGEIVSSEWLAFEHALRAYTNAVRAESAYLARAPEFVDGPADYSMRRDLSQNVDRCYEILTTTVGG